MSRAAVSRMARCFAVVSSVRLTGGHRGYHSRRVGGSGISYRLVGSSLAPAASSPRPIPPCPRGLGAVITLCLPRCGFPARLLLVLAAVATSCATLEQLAAAFQEADPGLQERGAGRCLAERGNAQPRDDRQQPERRRAVARRPRLQAQHRWASGRHGQAAGGAGDPGERQRGRDVAGDVPVRGPGAGRGDGAGQGERRLQGRGHGRGEDTGRGGASAAVTPGDLHSSGHAGDRHRNATREEHGARPRHGGGPGHADREGEPTRCRCRRSRRR